MAKKRDYKKEYRSYQGKPKQIKRRAQRNASRRKMMKAGKVRKGDGRDVDHKNHRTGDMSSKNLRVMSKHKNRSFHRKGKLKGQIKRK
jgi:hypothetical protein